MALSVNLSFCLTALTSAVAGAILNLFHWVTAEAEADSRHPDGLYAAGDRCKICILHPRSQKGQYLCIPAFFACRICVSIDRSLSGAGSPFEWLDRHTLLLTVSFASSPTPRRRQVELCYKSYLTLSALNSVAIPSGSGKVNSEMFGASVSRSYFPLLSPPAVL